MAANNFHAIFPTSSGIRRSSGSITQSATRRAPAVRRGLQEEGDDDDDDRPTPMSSSQKSATSLWRSSFPFSSTPSSTRTTQSPSPDVPTYASFMDKMTPCSESGDNRCYYGVDYTKCHSSSVSVASTCSSTSATTTTTTTTTSQSAYKSAPLPKGFQPGPYDVICARGKQVCTLSLQN